jgi:secondary thiamine-phosphate synthase enzyme
MPQTILQISTHGQGLYEFTDEAAAFVRRAGAEEGLLTVFVRHTSASLLIQENADDDVKTDLNAFFAAWCHPLTTLRCVGSSTPPKGPTTCRPISRRR